MIQIKYKTLNDGVEKTLNLPYADYYEPLEEGETYEACGIEKHLDLRDYLTINNSEISAIEVTSLQHINRVEYGEKNSITQHTIYKDKTEMLVMQSEIEPGVIHHIKLIKYGDERWLTSEINLIHDATGQIIDIK